MAACPNCNQPMSTEQFDARMAPRPIEVDACQPCRLLWFDKWESTNLAPRGVLGLFQYIGGSTSLPATPVQSYFDCIRCRIRLDPTRDLQRTTPFTYWRCSMGHGKLITFHQFLREKNFIRTPSPPELAKLRETIRQISCSQCGAPIDLAKDNACSHCAAPIAMIDPEGVARQVKELSEATAPPDATANAKARSAIIDAQLEAMLELERQRRMERHQIDVDLVSIGAQAIGGVLSLWLSSR